MKLYLYGHEYKYAVEQMLLTLFPDERPEYPDTPPEGERMEVSLTHGESLTTGSCALYRGGQVWRGAARAENAAMRDPLQRDRICQRLVKNAIYRAALRSGVKKPAWGALTGVRPGKLLAGLMNAGLDEKQAAKRFAKEYDVSPARVKLCLATTRETLRAEAALEARDVCLYVGIPFCPTRCAYCSFVSQSVEKSMGLIEPFLEALSRDIAATAAAVKTAGMRPRALYLGGGTPTTLSPAQLDRLLGELETRFDLSACGEITVEAGRPDTITAEKLAVLRAHGVTRVSVNPQSMSDRVLEAIGRRHSAEDVRRALELVRAAGDFQVNMDLIAGLPEDTPEGFAGTVEQVLDLGPENITVHTLALKKGSRIMLEGTRLPSDGDVAEMVDSASAALRAKGYAPYYLYRQKYMSGGLENVGWALSWTESLYNIVIMEELRSVIAMGAGASTKLLFPGNRLERVFAPKYPKEYIEGIDKVCADKEKITLAAVPSPKGLG